MTLLPSARVFADALARGNWRPSAETLRFREQLGLPTDRPIIMSGHQAQVWHAGILAKHDAMVVAAKRFGAHAAWLVVDTDVNDPFAVRYPVKVKGADGVERLETRVYRVDGLTGEDLRRHDGVPTGRRAAVRPQALPTLGAGERWAADSVQTGLAAIIAALDRAHGTAGVTSAAQQIAHAVGSMLSPTTIVMASALNGTDAFTALARDGARLRDTYNQTLVRAAVPGMEPSTAPSLLAPAGLTPLAPAELPLWSLGDAIGSVRMRATLGTFEAALAKRQLHPRALLLTGLVRLLACDVFIHGTGGAGSDGEHGYDAVTESWFAALGFGPLAPKAMVTATLRLPMELETPIPSLAEINRARWIAHAARHHPRLLDDPGTQRERDAIVARLAELREKRGKEARHERLKIYRQLQAVLDAARSRHAARLGQLREGARTLSRAAGDAAVVADRTWAFPLHDAARLESLREAITRAMS